MRRRLTVISIILLACVVLPIMGVLWFGRRPEPRRYEMGFSISGRFSRIEAERAFHAKVDAIAASLNKEIWPMRSHWTPGTASYPEVTFSFDSRRPITFKEALNASERFNALLDDDAVRYGTITVFLATSPSGHFRNYGSAE